MSTLAENIHNCNKTYLRKLALKISRDFSKLLIRLVQSGQCNVVSAMRLAQCGQRNVISAMWLVQCGQCNVASAMWLVYCGQCNVVSAMWLEQCGQGRLKKTE